MRSHTLPGAMGFGHWFSTHSTDHFECEGYINWQQIYLNGQAAIRRGKS